jgi:hypothetical protein
MCLATPCTAVAPPLADVDGQDLVALAREQLDQPRRYHEAMSGSMTEPAHLSATVGRRMYWYYPEGAVEQLFGLADDPHEARNLVGYPDYDDKCEELHRVLVQRHEARQSPLVVGGKLISWPLRNDAAIDRRNTSWPSYHTEFCPVDVRH